MFSVLRQTNFDLAIGEFLLDLCVGTACMLVLPGDDVEPIKFIPVPQYLIAFEEGPNGSIENVYRRLRIRNDVIAKQYPDAKIPPEFQRIIDQKPEEYTELYESTMYHEDDGFYHYYCDLEKRAR